MNILYATFESVEDFVVRLDLGEDSGVGRLKVATRARYGLGEPVVLEIGFPGLPNRVLIRATACVSHGEADALFELAPGEDAKRDFLLSFAQGHEAAAWKRKNRRFPIRLPARFVVSRDPSEELVTEVEVGYRDAEGDAIPLRGDAQTEDVCQGGVLLKTTRSLPDGARVTVVLDPCDGTAEMEFSGRVVYTRRGDVDNGIGVQFDKLNNDEMKRLRRMIRDVKLSGKVVEWEDALS
jgi:Tfp pilus assembly protein PilZ